MDNPLRQHLNIRQPIYDTLLYTVTLDCEMKLHISLKQLRKKKKSCNYTRHVLKIKIQLSEEMKLIRRNRLTTATTKLEITTQYTIHTTVKQHSSITTVVSAQHTDWCGLNTQQGVGVWKKQKNKSTNYETKLFKRSAAHFAFRHAFVFPYS